MAGRRRRTFFLGYSSLSFERAVLHPPSFISTLSFLSLKRLRDTRVCGSGGAPVETPVGDSKYLEIDHPAISLRNSSMRSLSRPLVTRRDN